MQKKEFLYVGKYTDVNDNFILKIGTTCDLSRRKREHTRTYKKSPIYTMPADGTFEYLWTLPLSKYNTIRYEDKNRECWKNLGIGNFIRNDRFILSKVPNFVPVTIRKTYQVALL